MGTPVVLVPFFLKFCDSGKKILGFGVYTASLFFVLGYLVVNFISLFPEFLRFPDPFPDLLVQRVPFFFQFFDIFPLTRFHQFFKCFKLVQAFDTLQVSWGRSDMHPHASTAWPGILLYGATVRAIGTGATGWYVAVMLLMGLSWHQYPSGQFVVIVPVIAFAVHAWQNRGFLRASWRQAMLIVAGVGLWILGYPLASFLAVGETESILVYVSRLGPRVLGVGDASLYSGMPVGELVARGARNSWELVLGLFTEVPRIFHQTVVPNMDGLAQRAMPWVVGWLRALGARRDAASDNAD